MIEIERRIQRAAERLLENESLTAGLDDPAARELLRWGLDWTHLIVESTAGLNESAAWLASGPRLKATRRLMRTVSRWAAKRSALDSAADQELLSKIYLRAAIAAGRSGAGDESSRQNFLDRAAALHGEPPELVGRLRHETEIAVGLKHDNEGESDA